MQEMKRVSDDGEAFLKVATSAPDYEDTVFSGIPDGHSGPTVCVKQYVTSTVTAVQGMATYYIATPSGDVAYWKTSVAIETDLVNGQDFTSFLFPKTGQIFPNSASSPTATDDYGGSNSVQISSGRIVTHSMEMSTLNNSFNQYGSITVWKVPLERIVTYQRGNSATAPVCQISVNGIGGVLNAQVGSQAYAAPVRDGAYAVSMNRQSEYDFTPVRDIETKETVHNAYYPAAPGANPGIRAKFNGPMALWDNNYDTLVFRIDVPANTADQSFLLKRWMTFEAEPVFNSLLWDTAHMSPRHDPAALQLYQEICRGLPVAVPYRDNPDFWRTVLEIVDEVSDVLSYVPGPVGGIAKGTHAITQVLRQPRRRKTKKNGRNQKKKKK